LGRTKDAAELVRPALSSYGALRRVCFDPLLAQVPSELLPPLPMMVRSKHVVQIWATEDPDEAMRWIEKQPPGDTRTAQLRARIEQTLAR
jgi:hypothetical protein